MSSMTIGQAAREAGVGVETIRYYQRQGLIDQPARRGTGFRHYDRQTVRRLRFIRHAKRLGFTLREIRELLELHVDPECRGRCRQMLELTSTKLADIEQRIAELERMKRTLSQLAAACRRRRSAADCPILDALDDGSCLDDTDA
ncbi:MAG: MerR family transcriptional regulator [Planctomycetes bacterium]|nr:MerR family transcriptional regulator [Planctomycetota bacterium]